MTFAKLTWTATGEPYASDYADLYFSGGDGLAETRAVFLTGNQLPARWHTHDVKRPLVIAETGFGTGLNFLATWASWRASETATRMHFISLEKHPLAPTDLARALQPWTSLQPLAQALQAAYPPCVAGCHRLLFADGQVILDLWLGDVIDCLAQWPTGEAGLVDAWYLDGFAPSKNPDMWTPQVFQAMARLSRVGATFSTFTTAGQVRRDLTDAGFVVEKITGFGRKRERLGGYFPTRLTTADAKIPPWYRLP